MPTDQKIHFIREYVKPASANLHELIESMAAKVGVNVKELEKESLERIQKHLKVLCEIC